MSADTLLSTRLKKHFLTHPRLWAAGFLLLWACANTLLLTTTALMDAHRMGRQLAWWEPVCWEVTSAGVLLLMIWPLARGLSWLQGRFSLPLQMVCHLLATLPFAAIHISGMTGLRKIWYGLFDLPYHFGPFSYEFLYEYRKDAMTYATLVVVIYCYRFIVLRLQGEARYVDEGEESSAPLPDRLLVKKLGREFLITVSDIAHIESSGNYANLHLGHRVYPMRITMKTLEARLPVNFCRVHRSHIVNTDYIDHIQPLDSGDYTIHMKNGAEIPLSRRYREACKSQLTGSQ